MPFGESLRQSVLIRSRSERRDVENSSFRDNFSVSEPVWHVKTTKPFRLVPVCVHDVAYTQLVAVNR